MRNRRYVKKKGPLVIYYKDQGLTRAFRNIPGVEMISVEKLSLLKLAPGGHLGRFCLWTESAFRQLDGIYGTWKAKSTEKKNYNLPMPKMSNTDVMGLMRSQEIQSVVVKKRKAIVHRGRKLNPLKNIRQLIKLNPYAAVVKRSHILDNKRDLVVKSANAKRDKRKVPLNPALDGAEKRSRRARHAVKRLRGEKTKKGTYKKWTDDQKMQLYKRRNDKKLVRHEAKEARNKELALRPLHHGLPWVRDQRKAVTKKITVTSDKKPTKTPSKKPAAKAK
jgi:large subunit ribosomal protein L4e